MTTFDERLRAQLRELDTAVPPAALPAATAGPATPQTVRDDVASVTRARPPVRQVGPNRRRQGIVLLAAVVALLAATAVIATSAPDPVVQAREKASAAAEGAFLLAAEERISDDLGPRFSAACVSLEDGRALTRSRLDALGYADWTIETRDGAENAQCVTGAGSGLRTVYLIPSMGGPVGAAIEEIRADLMRRCLTRDEAAALISTTLERLGATSWNVADDNRDGAPLGQEQAFSDHIAAGCWVYTRSESHPAGGRTYYIRGQ